MVEARGNSGGLAMLWSEENFGTITSFSQYHIDMEVQLPGYQTILCFGSLVFMVNRTDKEEI